MIHWEEFSTVPSQEKHEADRDRLKAELAKK
jgi:hypothetical protein